MSQNASNSNQPVGPIETGLLALLLGGGIIKSLVDNEEKIMRWFFYNAETIIFFGVLLILGIIFFIRARWKSKNPDLYEREMVLKSSRPNRNRRF